MTNEKVGKSKKKWECELCDYITCRSDNYKKHLLSLKHQNNENNTNEKVGKQICENKSKKRWICVCGKDYKHSTSLWNHKQNCNYIESDENCNEIIEKELDIKEMFLTIVNENKELRGMMIEQQETITEQSKQMTEIIPKIGNNTTNNTTNNNQRVNINVFLNDKCNDSINMSDFIKSILVSLEQFDFTKTHGLEKRISQVIIENMNKQMFYARAMSTLGKPIDGIDDKIVKKICSNTYLKESLESQD